MSALLPFAFGESMIRIIPDESGEPLFVGKDVAKALGYPENSLKQLNNLFYSVPGEWKGSNRIATLGGKQEVLVISEQGLYFFLGRSDKPSATLTSAPSLGTLNFPKSNKASRSLRQRPMLEKRAAFSVSATDALRALCPWDAVRYWRNNVLMFVRLRRLCLSRGALFRLFLFPILKSNRWLMSHSLFLSRSAALCGGFLSLELLARKLARFGEAQALLALLRLPIPMSARVRWMMRGRLLLVEVTA